MKKILSLILCSVVLLFASCTKEASKEQDQPTPPDTTGNNGGNAKLLTRIVDYELDYPGDSTITDFYYNERNKLIRTKDHFITFRTNLGYEDNEYIIYRDANDIVKRVAIMASHYEWSVFTKKDSTIYDVVYDPVSKHYKYAIWTANFEYANPPYDDFIRDSIVYTYNSNNQIVLWQSFRKDKNTNVLFEAERREYDFDAKGNMIKVRYNENYDNQGDPLSEDIIEYDDKINPRNFGMEGFLFGVYSFSWPTPNNPVKSEDGELHYTYDKDNYPVLGESASPDGGYKTFFYYK
ncbi:MAG: hypothetical protein QM802_09780 [Agriterribacter sp.]